MESVQLEHENVTELALVTLGDGVEEGRRLSKEEKEDWIIKYRIMTLKLGSNGIVEGRWRNLPSYININ